MTEKYRNPRFADFEKHLLDDDGEPLDPKFWGPPPSRWGEAVAETHRQMTCRVHGRDRQR